MGYFLAVLAVFFWSWNIIIASSFAYALSPFEIAFGRWFIASIILIAMNFKLLKKYLPTLLKSWKLVLSMALTGIVFDNTLIYFAGETASAVDIGLLGIIGPIFLVILSRIFLKTRVSFLQVIGMSVAIIGVVMIITNGNFSNLANMGFAVGDYITIVNTLCFAVYSLLQSLRPSEIPQKIMLTASALAGTALLLVSVIIFLSPSQLKEFTWTDAGVIGYLGVFNSVIAYMAWNTALAKIGNMKAGIIYYLLPIFSGLEAWLVLHENISSSQIVGGIIIIAGVFIVGWQKPRPTQRAKTAP